MGHSYHPVCSLTQQHSYFQAPETASLSLLPTPDTADKLRRAGLLLKATSTGLVLLRAQSDEIPGPVRPLPDFLFPLRFAVRPLSPYFSNFTALPEQLALGPPPTTSTIYYWRVKAAAPTGTLALTLPEARQLPLTPLTLSVAAPASGAQDNPEPLEIRDLVRDRPLRATMLHRNATGLSIDLRPWGAGHYQLQRQGKELLDCYADDQLHALQAWGVLEIDQPALAAGPLTLRLVLEARRTRWRYLVRYRPTPAATPAEPENASILVKMAKDDKAKAAQDDKEKIAKSGLAALPEFAVPPEHPATSPAANLVFESDAALPLAERPAFLCTLHYTLHGTPMQVALPAAQGELLCRPAVPATSPPGPAFSEIMVLL